MIPVKLQLKNFLSYGPDLQTINFGSYHLICLAGKNGHGKSALLDAITWAVWGQARKSMATTKADEGLLRLGETQMMVIFDFILGGQQYRVKREFMKTYGKPYAALEFGTVNPETDALIPLTDKTIRTTQERIDKTIHLTFESFVNSAFLRQGGANEFSKKSAKERKEVLASILGLDQYDTLRKRASEKAKSCQQECAVLMANQEKLVEELKQKEILQQSQLTLTQQLKLLSEQELTLDTHEQKLIEKQKKLIATRKAHDLLLATIQKIRAEEKSKTTESFSLATTWRTTHARLLKLPDYSGLMKTKAERAEQVKTFQNQLKRVLSLREQLVKTKEQKQLLVQANEEKKAAAVRELLIKGERIKAQELSNQKMITQFDHDLKQIGQESAILITEIETLKEKTAESKTEYELKTIELQFEKRKEYYQKYIALGNLLSTERIQSNQKMQLVHDELDPSCPLCEQNLSATRRKFLKQKFISNQQTLQHRIGRITRLVSQLKERLVEQHATLQQLKKKRDEEKQALVMLQTFIKSLQDFQKRAMLIDKQQKELILQNETLAHQQTELESLLITTQKQDEQSSELLKAHNEVIELEKAIAQQPYNEVAHQDAELNLKEVEILLQAYERMHEEKATQAERYKQIIQLNKQIRELRAQEQKITQELASMAQLDEQEQEQEAEMVRLQEEKKRLHREKNLLLEQKGKLEAHYTQITKYERELSEQSKRKQELELMIDDYQTIACASGKDGIQALLIEEAIPEIEQEANNLLSQLTNNQAHLFIDSLKDLKKGGTKETLDIKISDAQGIRPYELFSGGEAFRIDFALRIAISKLLARRAGTALQTLIIDEGFGSQDEEGLSLIMDALHKIQDNFEKVIIVSHLPTMKDQFPVHFVVEKKPTGSVVTVVEQA